MRGPPPLTHERGPPTLSYDGGPPHLGERPPEWLQVAIANHDPQLAAKLAKDPAIVTRFYNYLLDVIALQTANVPAMRLLLSLGLKPHPHLLYSIIQHKSNAVRAKSARDVLKVYVKHSYATSKQMYLVSAIAEEAQMKSYEMLHMARMLVRCGADPWAIHKDTTWVHRIERPSRSFVEELCRYKDALHTQRRALYALIGLRKHRRAGSALVNEIQRDIVERIARLAWMLWEEVE